MEFENLTAPISLERKTSHYIYEGMSFTADVREGVQWASLAENEDARLSLRYVEPETASPVSAAGLTLVAPRFLYDGGRLLAEADVVKAHIHEPKLLVSRPDASRLDLASGELAVVSRNGVSVELPVQVNRQLREGVVIVPRNLEGHPAEKLVGGGGHYTTVTVEKS